MSFLKSYLISNLSLLASNIFQLGSSIIIARSLGPSGKGAYSASYAICEVIVYLTLFGAGNGILYVASRKDRDLSKVTFHAFLVSSFSAFLSAIFLFLLGYFSNPLTKNLKSAYLFYLIPFSAIMIFFSNFTYLLFARREHDRAYILSSVSSALQFLLLSGFFLWQRLTITSVFLILIASNLIPFVYQMNFVLRRFGFRIGFDVKVLKELLKISYKSYFISLMNYIIVRSDLILINSIRGNYEAGIYSIAASLAGKMLLLSSPVYNILAPSVIEEPSSRLKFQLKVSRVLTVFFILLLLVADILYAPAVGIFYGKDFKDSLFPFIILNPGILFLALTNALSPYFVARGYPLVSIVTPAAAAGTNIVLNILLIPHFGYNAAAFTSSLSYLIYFASYARYISKKEELKLSAFIKPKPEEIKELVIRLSKKIFRK